MTGGRIKRIEKYVKDEDFFCLTYGDGLSNINISNLISFHKKHGKKATVTSVTPPGRFGAIELKNNVVTNFHEKPRGDGGRINGGFFVLSPSVLKLIPDDDCVWEQDPLMKLAKDSNLMAYLHDDFWHPMDTLRDKNHLEELWKNNKAPWRLWGNK